MKFPEKIDKLLEDNGIKNLRKLAEEIEIPYTTLWDYYSNQIRLDKANLTYMKKIAKRLGCTLDYLSYDEIENPTELHKVDIPKNPTDNKRELLFNKIGDLPEEKQQIILSVTENLINEIDKELDKQ